MTRPRPPDAIDVRHPLTLASSFRFPLQSAESRRDLVIGGLWLLVPVVGWLMNISARLAVGSARGGQRRDGQCDRQRAVQHRRAGDAKPQG